MKRVFHFQKTFTFEYPKKDIIDIEAIRRTITPEDIRNKIVDVAELSHKIDGGGVIWTVDEILEDSHKSCIEKAQTETQKRSNWLVPGERLFTATCVISAFPMTYTLLNNEPFLFVVTPLAVMAAIYIPGCIVQYASRNANVEAAIKDQLVVEKIISMRKKKD